MNKRHIGTLSAVLLIMTLALSFIVMPHPVYAANKMPAKLYKLVKGKWYTQASSGGYDIKFTKTKVKFYEHGSDDPSFVCKIKKVTKIKKGEYKGRYRVVFKNSDGNLTSFISTNKKASAFDYYFGDKGYEDYSGSGSIHAGRWEQ